MFGTSVLRQLIADHYAVTALPVRPAREPVFAPGRHPEETGRSARWSSASLFVSAKLPRRLPARPASGAPASAKGRMVAESDMGHFEKYSK